MPSLEEQLNECRKKQEAAVNEHDFKLELLRLPYLKTRWFRGLGRFAFTSPGKVQEPSLEFEFLYNH